MNKQLKPRHKQLNDALLEKKGGPHIPRHKPVVRSRENTAFRRMIREFGVA